MVGGRKLYALYPKYCPKVTHSPQAGLSGVDEQGATLTRTLHTTTANKHSRNKRKQTNKQTNKQTQTNKQQVRQSTFTYTLQVSGAALALAPVSLMTLSVVEPTHRVPLMAPIAQLTGVRHHLQHTHNTPRNFKSTFPCLPPPRSSHPRGIHACRCHHGHQLKHPPTH